MSREREDESKHDETRDAVNKADATLEATDDDALKQLMRAARPGSQRHGAILPEGATLHGGRIEVVRRLGSGAMGSVYEARDRGTRIALKTLNSLTPDQLYRLKREFRFLTEVMHPNVVVVYELFVEAEDDTWFFTMECVRGLPLDRYWALHRSRDDVDANLFPEADVALIRRLLRQIVDGVCAIHDAGLLHRDLKPNNILVEPDGRVVILDFGLVSGQLAGDIGQTVAHQISGTPGFMSPEQAVGATTSTASDWYAVGVILYQLLTRRLPHQGTLLEVLHAKQAGDVTPPRALVPGVPEELDALCLTLLERDPLARPTSAQMRALSHAYAAREPGRPSAPHALRGETDFVGRAGALAALAELYAAAQTRPVFALVRAESGLGKSELLRNLVDFLQRNHDPFIVRGRCYEREAVPYKALDEAVDDLTRILVRLPEEQAHQLVPRHAQTLTRLFPVLLRVPAFREAVSGRPTAGEGQVQRLGSGALRELLARIADRRPLVLVIDDLQWSDVDSLRLLADVLAPPDPPNLFVVGSCRSPHGSSALDELLAQPGLTSRILELEPLTHVEARELALSALPSTVADGDTLAERIARESGGNPLYVLELASAAGFAPEALASDSLERLIQRRIEALPGDARTMLELASLTGRPLPRELLSRACGEISYPTALSTLRAAKLVHRTGSSAREEALEPYHDRVRAAVLSLLDREQQVRHHAALARALEASEQAEPEWLAQHLQGAGRVAEAQHYALQAARKASAALAYNRAADLFALALELRGDARGPELHREHGDALACAGRGAEAAEAYLLAADEAPPQAAALLEGLAAAQRLRVGHVEQAVVLLRKVLARNGLPWPETFSECIARFLFNRVRIRMSGLKFSLRAEHEVPRALLDKLDALYPAQTALGTFDYVRGACFASMALPLALEAGEPKRLVTALASEAVYNVMLDGGTGTTRAGGIQNTIDKLSSGMSDPYGGAVAELTASLCAYWSGRWARVLTPSHKAEQIFGQEVSDGTWEAALVRSVRHTVEIHAGALPSLAREVPGALLDASERNDRYGQLDLMRSLVVIHLRDDRVDDARTILREMDALLVRFPVVSLNHLIMAVKVSFRLYTNDVAQAKAQLDTLWADCRRNGLHRFPLLRLNHLGMVADCTLADWSMPVGQRVHELKGLARAAAKEPIEWAAALAKHLEGEALVLAEKGERALRVLDEAYDSYTASGMPLAAAVVRMAQSGCAPTRRGEELAREPLAFFAAQGIVRPDCWRKMVHSVY